MRVLEVNVDDIGRGGVFSFVMNLIRNRQDQGMLVDVCSFEAFEQAEHIREVEQYGGEVFQLIYQGPKVFKQRACADNLEKLLRERSYDVVHIHADVSNKLLAYAVACRRAGVPYVIVHSHSSGVDHGHRAIKAMLHRLSRGRLNGKADRYVACSTYAAKWMYPDQLRRQQPITILNNGIDVDKFTWNPQVRQQVRAENHWEDSVVFGHVGRFDYQKNHDFLIDVFAALAAEIPNAKLLLIGEGGGQGEIQEKVKRMGLEERVVFWGTTNEVWKLLQAMDLFLLPSHFEGLPISGVEAQAAGLPVIFSNQITPEAKLTGHVRFAPIDGSTQSWVDYARELLDQPREDTSAVLKEKGYDNFSSIRALENLYHPSRSANQK